MLADAAAALFGIVASFAIQWMLRPVPAFLVWDQIGLVVLSVPGFLLGAGVNHLYLSRANERVAEEVSNILKAVAVAVTSIVIVALATQFKDVSRLWVALVAGCVAISLLVERRIARRVFTKLRTSGRSMRRIVIVGTDPHAIGLMHMYQRNPALGYEVVGFVGDDDLGERGGVSVLGSPDELMTILGKHDAVGVVVSPSTIHPEQINRLARRLTEAHYHVALSSTLEDIDVTRLRPQDCDGRTMIYVEPVIRGGWRAWAKRAFDVGLACALLVVTAPILLVAMIAIKVDSRGPILFKQIRVGKGGEPIWIIKLRTMTTDAEDRKQELTALNEVDGPLFKISHDPRVTRVGRVLRKLSIDELPQLICVIRGDMSIVGPRPALPSEMEQWDPEVHERLRVLPGLTGLWQVSGRSASSFDQYKRLDLYYVDNWSLVHDLNICFRTIGVVTFGRGAS